VTIPKRKAKFSVGQVVAIITLHDVVFDKIEEIANGMYNTQIGYWEEHELRPLTPRESGRIPSKRSKKR
jgi:hypothetical protein